MNFLNKIKAIFFGSDNAQTDKDETVIPQNGCTGTVQYFNHSRGYGFIDSKAFDRRVFLHISDLEDRVHKGQRVKFKVEKTSKGLRAKNVETASA
jgi:CspA family cold shock protein